MDTMTIGQVARATRIGVDAVRFYEREGLIDKPGRTPTGYRNYRPEVVARLRFIQQAKKLGFSLSEIKGLLALRITPGKSCADVKARADEKIADVDRLITSLKRIRQALAKLASACSGNGPVSQCPILEALGKE